MSEQQRGKQPFSKRPLLPGELGYRQLSSAQLSRRQLHIHRRRLRVGSRQVMTAGLSLLLLLCLYAARSAVQLVPRTRHLALSTSLNHLTQSPTPTTQATPNARSALIASHADTLLTDELAQRQFSGSVLIAQRGQVLLSKGYGMADWAKQMPNTAHTKFYLGSTTKPFTAMAVLILQQQGKLHVRDALCSYLPSCPQPWQSVTIHDLLTHTSGIPQLDDSDLSNASPQSWLASFDNVPLVSAPGSQFSYCNVCYQILGYLVEQVSGEPYSAFLQRQIFTPLQMRNTGFDPRYLSLPDHAIGYASWQVQDVPVAWDVSAQWSFLFAAGLLYSTAEDLYRWDQALSSHTLVSQQTLNEAFRPYVASQYAGSRYGYGWFITQAPAPEHQLIWHDGKIPGFRSYNGYYPAEQVTIILLSNLATLDDQALATSLEQIVFAHH